MANKKKTVADKDSGIYKITVKIFNKLFTSEGKTLEEALSKLNVKNAKGLSVWSVERDGKITQKVVQSAMTFRLFNSRGISRDVALKNFNLMFKQ